MQTETVTKVAGTVIGIAGDDLEVRISDEITVVVSRPKNDLGLFDFLRAGIKRGVELSCDIVHLRDMKGELIIPKKFLEVYRDRWVYVIDTNYSVEEPKDRIEFFRRLREEVNPFIGYPFVLVMGGCRKVFYLEGEGYVPVSKNPEGEKILVSYFNNGDYNTVVRGVHQYLLDAGQRQNGGAGGPSKAAHLIINNAENAHDELFKQLRTQEYRVRTTRRRINKEC